VPGDCMRASAAWMQQLDERILDAAESERFVSPASLKREFPHLSASRSRINERCEMLQRVGFLVPIVEVLTTIT
jgi:hypothetical protein